MTEENVSGDETVVEQEDERTEKRREFLKTAANVAVTTSAVTLMVAAGAKRNKAVALSGDGAGTMDGDEDVGEDPPAGTRDAPTDDSGVGVMAPDADIGGGDLDTPIPP